MVNNDRIVPITKTDYLSLLATSFNMLGAMSQMSMTAIPSADAEGNFAVTADMLSGQMPLAMANQPVKTMDIASDVTAGAIYFVADYNFDTITIGGEAITLAEGSVALDEIKKDAVTLYALIIGQDTVGITAVTPSL